MPGSQAGGFVSGAVDLLVKVEAGPVSVGLVPTHWWVGMESPGASVGPWSRLDLDSGGWG